VIVNSGFRALPKSSQRFILLHECGHIFHQDVHIDTAIDFISLIAARILFPLRPFIAVALVSVVMKTIASFIQERRADAFAIERASNEELQGGIAVLNEKQKQRSLAWTKAKTFASQCSVIYGAFNYYVLGGHPLESSRIHSIQREVQARLYTQTAPV
jgi:beta-lactamase regulating signal transducer with metallopeptidase domain